MCFLQFVINFCKRTDLSLCLFFSIHRCALFMLFRCKIPVFLHQVLNSLGHVQPGEFHFVAAIFLVSHTFTVVIFAAMGSQGQRMRSATGTILLFQPFSLFLRGMRCLVELIDSSLATFKTGTTGDCGINFIFCDELWNCDNLCHFRRVFLQGQLRFFQACQQFRKVMIMEPKQRPILIVQCKELSIFVDNCRTKIGVKQLICQPLRFIREIISANMGQTRH